MNGREELLLMEDENGYIYRQCCCGCVSEEGKRIFAQQWHRCETTTAFVTSSCYYESNELMVERGFPADKKRPCLRCGSAKNGILYQPRVHEFATITADQLSVATIDV